MRLLYLPQEFFEANSHTFTADPFIRGSLLPIGKIVTGVVLLTSK